MEEQYLIEHLKTYARFEIQQGYHLNDIRDALLKYGYKKQLVHKVVGELSHVEMPRARSPPKEAMTEQMHLYIQDMLIDYVEKQLKNGYSKNAIKAALFRSGHHKDMVEKAFSLISQGKIVDYDAPITKAVFPPFLVFLFSIFLLTVFVLFISISTNYNLLEVILTFAPAYFTLAVTYLVITSTKSSLVLRLMPILAAGVSILCFVIFLNYTLIYIGRNMNILLVLNVISSFLLSGFMCILSPKPRASKQKLTEGKVIGSSNL